MEKLGSSGMSVTNSKVPSSSTVSFTTRMVPFWTLANVQVTSSPASRSIVTVAPAIVISAFVTAVVSLALGEELEDVVAELSGGRAIKPE